MATIRQQRTTRKKSSTAKKRTTQRKTSRKKVEDSFWDQITDIAKPTSGIKYLMYGKSGTGKTRTAVTFPKPLLLVRAEDGTRSVWDVAGVKVTPIIRTADDVLDVCTRQMEEKTFKTLVLDTATSLADTMLAEILGLEKLPEQLSYGDATRDQYGERAIKLKEVLRILLDVADLGTDVIIIGQERGGDEEESSDVLTPTVSVGLSPSVKRWIEPEVDYITQSFIRRAKERVKLEKPRAGKTHQLKEVTQYCARLGPHPVYTTKFRVPSGTTPPAIIVDPTFEKLNTVIEGTASANPRRRRTAKQK